MTREQIIEAVNKVKNGRIARVTYMTELPVKAAFKKQGYSIVKVVETTGRLGVNYHHIAAVIARKAEEGMKEAIQRANNYEWIIQNKVKHNTVTDKDYLVLANFRNGHNTKTKYIVTTLEGQATYSSLDFLKSSELTGLVIDSYWKPSKTGGEVRNIAFENILCINKIGDRVTF